MPLYEGIGLISEKHAVVIDIGSAFTKCGFAGETGPRCIIPTQVNDTRTGKVVKIYDYRNEEHLYCLLVDFFHHLYFRQLLINPKDRRVVVVESVFTPTSFRETLAKVLFSHYEVSSVLFGPTHLMALYTLAINSALVIDFGHLETLAIPIYEGVVMLNSNEEFEVGSKFLHNNLKSLLVESATANVKGNTYSGGAILDLLTDDIVEDICVRTCFITPFARAQKIAEGDNSLVPPPNVDYPLSGSSVLHIPGSVREQVTEALYNWDGEEKSAASLVLDCILQCPIDMRKTLAENIVIMGGTAMLPGFRHRLMAEMKELLKHKNYRDRMAIKSFKFHKPPAKENYVAWLGASIFGATDAATLRSLTRDQYLHKGCIPDWSKQDEEYSRSDEKTV